MATPDSSSRETPPIVDRRRWPMGNLPRHIQAWTLLGIAGLMTAVMLLSGPATPTTKPPINPALQTTDPNRGRIEQYQRQLDETAQRLAAERAELELLKATLKGAPPSTTPPPQEGTGAIRPTTATTAGTVDGVEQDSRQRAQRSLFATSVVWTAPTFGTRQTATPERRTRDMWNALLLDRAVLSALASAVIGLAGLFVFPFPREWELLQVVWLHAPGLHRALSLTYTTVWFTTPFLGCFSALSVAFIFWSRLGTRIRYGRLPPYPQPERRGAVSLVLGEVHHPTRVERAAEPDWLEIPEKGLYTGVLVVGAVGSGKTSGCMYPYVDQVLGYRAWDPAQRIGGLILEVKGDFCESIRQMLGKYGRIEDYLEIGLQSRYRYNPLAGDDVDAYAFAFGINSVMVNLYGKGDDPFWAQAQVNLIKFLILLHQVVDGYVTLWDVYVCAINPDRVAAKLKAGAWRYGPLESIVVSADDYVKAPDLSELEWTIDGAAGTLTVPRTADVDARLAALKVPHQIVSNPLTDPGEERRRQQFTAVERWFHDDWSRIEAKLRTSIVEGVSVFLSIFDSDPDVKYTFCPPRECYDPVANANGRFGIPLPPFEHLIEQGTVVALNFPTVTNPGLARAIATFAKMDFQRAVLKRIPLMARDPERHWRPVLLAADECHAIVTCGEDNPIGDERFLSQSRQAKLIPILATQSLSSLRSVLPGESWRTLVQTLRTKVFLTLSDDFSAKFASDLCGKVEQLRPQYSMSESGQDARVSVLTGLSTAQRSSVTASRGYHVHRDLVFEPKAFSELKNAQAIVLAYTGSDPLPPTLCYLKPWYLDPNISYFDQLKTGALQ